jgi:hypothetical protein
MVVASGLAAILTGLAIVSAAESPASGDGRGDSPLAAGLCGLACAAILIPACVLASRRWRAKWAAVTEVRVRAPVIHRDRGVIRRRDLMACIVAWFLVLFPVADWALRGSPWPMAGAVAPPVVFFALVGWGGKLVVSAESIEVYSLASRVSVARSLISGVGPDRIGVLIALRNGDTVAVAVGMSPMWSKKGPDPRDYRAEQLKTMARLNALLEAIPQTPPSGPGMVSAQTRYLPWILLTASVVAFLAVFVPF